MQYPPPSAESNQILQHFGGHDTKYTLHGHLSQEKQPLPL